MNLRKLHEFHEKHERLWWIVLGVVATVGLLIAASQIGGV